MAKAVNIAKTNAMRLLDAAGIAYIAHGYDDKDGKIDGVSVAQKMGMPIEEVYKTLVTIGASGEFFVFVIPVAKELDLKKAAKAAGEKHIEMCPSKDLLKHTGYIHGGCSPIGMKKPFRKGFQRHGFPLKSRPVFRSDRSSQTPAPPDIPKAPDFRPPFQSAISARR